MAACGHFRVRRWAVPIGREWAFSCPPMGSFSCPPTHNLAVEDWPPGHSECWRRPVGDQGIASPFVVSTAPARGAHIPDAQGRPLGECHPAAGDLRPAGRRWAWARPPPQGVPDPHFHARLDAAHLKHLKLRGGISPSRWSKGRRRSGRSRMLDVIGRAQRSYEASCRLTASPGQVWPVRTDPAGWTGGPIPAAQSMEPSRSRQDHHEGQEVPGREGRIARIESPRLCIGVVKQPGLTTTNEHVIEPAAGGTSRSPGTRV